MWLDYDVKAESEVTEKLQKLWLDFGSKVSGGTSRDANKKRAGHKELHAAPVIHRLQQPLSFRTTYVIDIITVNKNHGFTRFQV